MEIYFCVSFSASCEADGIQIAVSFLRLQSPTVVTFVNHLKFWFLADNTASVWPKLFLLFLEREQSQHFSPKAVADLVPSAACTQRMFPFILLCYQVQPFCNHALHGAWSLPVCLSQVVLATPWKQQAGAPTWHRPPSNHKGCPPLPQSQVRKG